MRILVVSQHFWPESFRINDICDGLVERDFEVDVLCGIPNYPKGYFYDGYGWNKNRRQQKGNIKIRRCIEIKRGKNSNIRIFFNYISFPFFSLFSLPYLMKQKYDKIFMYQTSPVLMTVTGIMLGRIKKIETIMYVLDLWPENLYTVLNVKNKLLRSIAYRVSLWHYRKADKIIANSKKLLEILKNRTNKDDNKITYIPHFCEKLYENTVPDEKLIAQFSNRFNIVYAGNISPAQSFDTVVFAADKLKNDGYSDINWIIVGDGMSRLELEKQVEQKGLSDCFTFVGHVPMEEIAKYSYIADGLFACLSKSEMLDCAIPAKVFSYYAAGKPLVLAMDGEVQQIIHDSGAGFVVDAEDSEGFADMVIKLYNTSLEKRKNMSENAEKYYFEHFERNKNMDKLVEFILAV
ncbi:MAG: glycosyltransferase family 4 protein [Oscillospiraceae bacterium]|jgi:glycosyltransferase involved in cell wall biosynthesis|nr:glycosyltransferase family 4 protein [Oscillospiraceae bacterium]